MFTRFASALIASVTISGEDLFATEAISDFHLPVVQSRIWEGLMIDC
jgi:hypothetical protein